uniref:Phosphoribosylamine--glycine ligase n=1 Tax=candidate division WOR-3 bacterium TaxID=2052148 RepID=A0A7V3ZXU2_UNCW3
MRIAVVGKGGREDAITHKISQSPLVEKLFVIPGNPGTARYAKNVNIEICDFESILNFVNSEKVDIVVPGPELPISKGIKNYLESNSKVFVFAPPLESSFLEASKIMAKEFMKRNAVPTADFKAFSDYDEALKYVKGLDSYPIVIKADGLAEGKGVSIAYTPAEAFSILYEYMVELKFGESSRKVLIEEFLTGVEYSVFVVTDGEDFLWIGDASDYKRAYDGDKGPNTGGMGSVSPVPFLTDEMRAITRDAVIKPTIEGLKRENIPYMGFLYFGLIWTSKGPKVLEFNVRLGDPEAQVILPRLKNDIVEIILSAKEHRLKDVKVEFDSRVAVCVVVASGGYPVHYEKGKLIHGLNKLSKDIVVYHAGTKELDGKIYTDGGRVLNLVALHNDFNFAAERIYSEIEKIHFENLFYRRDIGSLERFKI